MRQLKSISLSLGATRTFKLRFRKDRGMVNGASRSSQEAHAPKSFVLKNGDVIMLTKSHVTDWEHSIIKTSKPTEPRTNFTFRSIN